MLDADGDCFRLYRTPPADAYCQFAGQGVERNTEQGKAAAIFLDDRQRLFAPMGGWRRIAGRPEVDHGDAARNRCLLWQGTSQQGQGQGEQEQEMAHG